MFETWLRNAWITARLAYQLANWPEISHQYLTGQPLAELRLRNGIVLHHGADDAPVLLLFEVFADGVYRKHFNQPFSGTVIDIGANIGAAALDFCFKHPGIRVHAYEPNPTTLDMLVRNVHHNGVTDRVTVYGEAVGSSAGQLRLWTNCPSVVATAYSDEPPFPGCVPVMVTMIDLNNCIARITEPHVALLKIDAEGAEVDILEHAKPAAFARINNVALEYHDDLCDQASQRCRGILERAGFSCLQVAGREAHRGMLYGWRHS